MLPQNSSCINWHFLLVGLFFIIMQCDARAVNVSNTWTMPQEGLNVFYRFFRDRISWFEADAVCQFHHANLVTVDNSFQFDATRDLLRELDVNDIVWIGLMRPQSSDRFMWSNSRPLVADTGYWAESLPLMDAPLCAVIDPIRDYRWHALRCGGPETASFLCEMPVPTWADACNLKDMPNLTLQYMADTASIELIRNCQEEGLLRTMCRGKQDRERALQDLICPRERLEAQRINDITNSHFKSLQIINSIPSDNNENNDIELLPLEVNYGPHYPEELQTEKNTVQRLIEQFNVDELMQADEPSNMETVSSFYKIPGLIPKPVKKSAKKVLDYPKKDNGKQKGGDMTGEQAQKDRKRLEMEDMMMGDQPLQGEPEMPEQFLNEEVSNEILEPLPHIKKTNIHKEDGLEKMEKEAIAMKKSMQKSKEMENKKMLMMSSSTTTTTTTEPASTTTTTTTTTSAPTATTEKLLTTTADVQSTTKADELTTANEDHTHKHHHYETHTEFESTGGHLTTTSTSATIGHPMHPQQPRSNVITEETQHPHAKESADNSHFIPPMLMVKSHYVPPANKHGHNEREHHQHHHQQEELHHEDDQTHLETTTGEQAETTITKQQQNQTSDNVMTVTTPKVLDLEKTTLKTLDTSASSSTESEKPIATTRQEEQKTAAITTTTESDSSIKPITEQQTTETEQRKNSKNLHFEEIQTTMTATTIQTVASTTTASAVSTNTQDNEETTLPNSSFEEINKNKAGHEKVEEEAPQTIHTVSKETTQNTNLVTTTEKPLITTEKLSDLQTAVDNIQKTQEIADTTTAEAPTEKTKQQQHVITMEEKLLAIKNEEYKEHLQTVATTQKLTTTERAQVITTSTMSAQMQQQNPTTITTETQSLPQMEKNLEDEKQGEQEEGDSKQTDQDKKETIVKTTEILVTSSATAKEEDTQKTTTTPATLTTSSSSITTTTTVKPITTTTPQNEVKSTETSFSSTSIIITTTTNMPTTTNNGETSTTTITPPTTTTFSTAMPSSSSSSPAITTTTIDNEAELATARAETSTETSSPPETTRNFLKVTTEMPFKPNRRRSLTKPETVSYMKKILG
ncbi:mucin-5AC isoform X2 [Lucilia cuprina]|uniref:mucin-5AC isoform X2 n=1 Tax=Lucilia cuprina TaxID=7375 RepID=UPI001F066CE7|nr:mucin-5AC isoform X2 [Lucilia cuprina]